ncbi:tyrosine-type recombinase/integrase [Thalassiella azotivora]
MIIADESPGPPEDAARSRHVPLSSLVESFLTDRATLTRRGLTERSRAAYRLDLRAWAAQLVPGQTAGDDAGDDALTVVTVGDLTADALKAAYRRIRTTSAASTCQRRVGTLKLFTHWLQVEGHLDSDPTLRIEAPVRPGRLPAGWDDDELLRLGRAVSTPAPGRDARRWPARDRAVFAVLVTTGLRASELCSLTDRSLRLEGGGDAVLTVIGKGNKQRNLPVPPEAVDALQEYLADREHRLGRQELTTPLFRLTNGRPMTPGALNHLVDSWVRRSGVTKQDGEAAHGFRHTFAKGLVRSGVPAPSVQALLGHEDLKTTGIYVKATASDVRDAVLLGPARSVLRETAPGAGAHGPDDATADQA